MVGTIFPGPYDQPRCFLLSLRCDDMKLLIFITAQSWLWNAERKYAQQNKKMCQVIGPQRG